MSEIDPEDFEAQLDEIITGFGSVSVEAQQGVLYDVLNRLEKEREDTGISAKIATLAGALETINTVTLHRLYHFDDPRGVIEEHYFHVAGTATRINGRQISPQAAYVKVPVSQTIRGARYPMIGFDRYDAAIIAGQVTQLDNLKADGLLPNLSPNLGFIVDPRTEVVLPPKK